MLPESLLPLNGVDLRNPVFHHLWLHQRLINTKASFQRFNRIALIGIPAIVLLWWFIERANLNFGEVQPDLSIRLPNLVLVLAIAFMFITSFYSIPTVLGLFHRHFNPGYWETLRLTPQYDSTILMSHDAIAQLRLWPFTILEVALRTAFVILFALNIFYSLYLTSADKMAYFAQSLLSLSFWLVWGALFIAFGFIIEPIIRARLIVALHMIIAIRVRYAPLTVLASVLELLIIHSLQVILMVCIYAMINALARPEVGGVMATFCLVPLIMLAVILFWMLYRSLRRFALSLAYKSAFKQD